MAVAEIPRLPPRGASIAGTGPRSENASIPAIYTAEALQSKVWACRMAFGPSASRGRRQAVRQQYSQPAHARSGRAFPRHTDSGQSILRRNGRCVRPLCLSAIINDETLPRLKAKIVAGSANNQLAEHQHGDELRARNILYAPDYAINAGGVINISYEYSGIYNQQATHRHVSGIGRMLSAILKRACRPDISTNAAAYHIAENCFRALEAAQNAFKPFVPHFGEAHPR